MSKLSLLLNDILHGGSLLSRKKKGSAPILATLLMIAVAVAMGVIIFMWPQVFLEFADGSTRHIFTGNPDGVSFTEEGFSNLLKSNWFKDLKQQGNS